MTPGNSAMAGSLGAITAPAPREAARNRPLLSRGWDVYLVIAVLLVPILYPPGPSQMAIEDPINAVALLLFFGTLAAYRLPYPLPFAFPVFVALLGSVLAMLFANNVVAGVLALTKDAYLYFWYAALVMLLRPRGNMRLIRLAWVWTGVIVALSVYGTAMATGQFTVQALLLTNRERAVGTFNNPNMLADYQVYSIFVLLGLAGQVRRRFFWPVLLLLLSSVVTAKSNGGLISLVTGLTVYGFATAWARGVSPQRIVGAIALIVALIMSLVWLHGEFGVGDAVVKRVTGKSFIGRMGNSGAQRGQIWHRLVDTYQRAPLGIGPKNSSEQTVMIGERERPDSYRSKEAHDDYLAFAIERGPLGFLGLMIGVWMVIEMVLRSRPALDRRLGSRRFGGTVWASFVALLAASSVHSLVIEKLHFRHFWFFFALVTAMCMDAETASDPIGRGVRGVRALLGRAHARRAAGGAR